VQQGQQSLLVREGLRFPLRQGAQVAAQRLGLGRIDQKAQDEGANDAPGAS